MASFKFVRGDPDRPVGHAFLLFRIPGEPDTVAATYLIIPPIAIDFAKYVPPLIASSLGASGLIAQTKFLPVPPAPERILLGELEQLAERRNDDVVDSSVSGSLDPASLMAHVADLGDAYADAYEAGKDRAPRPAPVPASPQPSDSLQGMAVLYSMLSEHERIEELARRVGTLRYAVEGGDKALAEGTRSEMRAIGTYLPEKYRFEDLMAAATRPDASGTRLAQLYIERGYKLAGRDEEGLASLDAEIASLHRAGQ